MNKKSNKHRVSKIINYLNSLDASIESALEMNIAGRELANECSNHIEEMNRICADRDSDEIVSWLDNIRLKVLRRNIATLLIAIESIDSRVEKIILINKQTPTNSIN